MAPGHEQRVRARKLVDASYMDVRVPATTPPGYACAGGARLVPINGLATLSRAASRYVVLGAGKTGIDAILHLLDHDVRSEAISWVMPGDAWLLNRDNIQPDRFAAELLDQMRLIHEARDLDTMLDALEARERLLRLDPAVRPTRYRCATVTKTELEALRRVRDVIRLGRVSRIDGATLHLADGERRLEEPVEQTLYVDCTADGLAPRPARRIFEPARITLQSISMCQQVMSAAAIAALELREASDLRKNATLQPVPHPSRPGDYPWAMWQTTKNVQALASRLFVWTFTRRLSGVSHLSWPDTLRFLIGALRFPPPPRDRVAALVGDHPTTLLPRPEIEEETR